MLPSTENKNYVLSRLFIYLLLGIAIFSTIYATQKVITTKPPVTKKSPPETILTPTATITDKNSKEDNSRCIVTIMDKRYDVTDFKSEHEGGDIFICGADMTRDYNKEHGKELERAYPYEIDSEGNFVNKQP